MEYEKYFNPPNDFSIKPLEGFFNVGFNVQLIIGFCLILATVIYLAITGFMVMKGIRVTHRWKVIIAGFTVSILLVGNGWIRVLKVQDNIIREPIKAQLHKP